MPSAPGAFSWAKDIAGSASASAANEAMRSGVVAVSGPGRHGKPTHALKCCAPLRSIGRDQDHAAVMSLAVMVELKSAPSDQATLLLILKNRDG